MLEEPLDVVLKSAKPGWSQEDRSKVITKLGQVKILTTEEFAEALRHNNINARLKSEGLKTFSADTLRDLRAYLGLGLSGPKKRTAQPKAPGRLSPDANLEVKDVGAVGCTKDLVPASEPSSLKATTPAPSASSAQLSTTASLSGSSVEQAHSAAAESEASDREGDGEVIPDYRTLLQDLDSATDYEAAEERAKALGIPVDRLDERHLVFALVDSLERLDDSNIPELRTHCDRLRLAYGLSTSKDELKAIVRQGLIWDELNSATLREECEQRGLMKSGECDLPRREMLATLADSTWEALDVPVRRFANLQDARSYLHELLRHRAGGQPHLRGDPRSVQVLPPSLVAEQLPRVALWLYLPSDELAKECSKMGLVPKDFPQDAAEEAKRAAHRSQLMHALRVERCKAAGVPPERAGGLAAAEAVLQDAERLRTLDLAELRGEEDVQKFKLEQMLLGEDTEKEKEALLQLLKDVKVWHSMPLNLLEGECRVREVAFPDVFAASSHGGVPEHLFIAGKWNDFEPQPMNKAGKKFRTSIETGEGGFQTFQLLLSATWSKTLYPSVEDANPYVPHHVLGPNDGGHGKNWSIGFHPKDREFSKPGAKCRITVSFDEDVPVVFWDNGRSSILERPGPVSTPSTAAATGPRRTQAPRRPGTTDKVQEREAEEGQGRELIYQESPPAALVHSVQVVQRAEAIRELVRTEVQLRMLEGEGVSVANLKGSAFKDLLDDFNDMMKCPTAELVEWYQELGLPVEKDLEHKELLRFVKRTTAWQFKSLSALKQESSTVQYFNHSTIDESHKDGTEEQQRAYFLTRLMDQDRMNAWDTRGYEALRVGCVDSVIEMVCDYERMQELDDAALAALWKDAQLPLEELGAPRERVLRVLKHLLVWTKLPLHELEGECAQCRGSQSAGQSGERLREDLMAELKGRLFQAALEAIGLPVDALGPSSSFRIFTDMERLKVAELEDLRKAYEGEQNFLPRTLSRDKLLEYLRDVSVWEALPIGQLWKHCEARGIIMRGFEQLETMGGKESAVKKLREDLLDRLIYRDHLVAHRRTSSPKQRPYTETLGNLAAPEGFLGVDLVDSGFPAQEVGAVWRFVEVLRDPFIAERFAGVPRKPLPASQSALLPQAAQFWQPLEAALHVLSGGKFNPDRDGRKAEEEHPACAPAGKPLLSVVCPTSGRREHFHSLLYECYQNQDYEPKELVIVDSGGKPSDFFNSICKRDRSVIYRFFDVDDSKEGQKHTKVAWSLGLKRNIACSLARGAAMIHFDDDDIYAPGYLRWMHEQLAIAAEDQRLQRPAAAKLTEWYTLDISTQTFRYLDVESDPNVPIRERHGWLYGWGFSYAFTRSAWELAPFPDVEFAEDIAFFEGLLAHNVHVRLAPLPKLSGVAGKSARCRSECLVAHSWHPGSTSGGEAAASTRKPGQMVAVPEEVKPLLGYVKVALNAQKGPLVSQRTGPFSRPGQTITVPGHTKWQQAGFRPTGQQQIPFGMAVPFRKHGAKSVLR